MTSDEGLEACLSQVLARRESARPARVVSLPSARDPRVFVPADSRRSAARALTRRYGGRSLRGWIRAGVLSVAILSGLGPRLPPWRTRLAGDSSGHNIHTWLAEVIGEPYRVSLVFVGPKRANRKPVVFVTDPNDELIAVVKIGYNEVTRPLVRYEATALASVGAALAGCAHTPSLLGAGRIDNLEAMAMRPLPPLVEGRQPTQEELVSIVREISASGGQPRRPLSSVLGHVRMEPLIQAVAAIDEALVAAPVGSIHGDFHPGNVGFAKDGRAVVWDWERWGDGIPRGFDLLHYNLQSWITRDGVEPEVAARRLIATACDLLGPLDIEADLAADVARDYLVRLAARYVADSQDRAGSRLGRVEEWLFPAVRDTRLDGR